MNKIETFLYAQTPELDPQTEFFYDPDQCQARNLFVGQTVDELFRGKQHSRVYDQNRQNYFDMTTSSTLAVVEPLLHEMISNEGYLYLNGGSTPRIQSIDPDARVKLVDHIGGQISNALCKEARQRTDMYKTNYGCAPIGSDQQEQLVAALDGLFDQGAAIPSHDRHQLLESTHFNLVGFGKIKIPVDEFHADLEKWINILLRLQDCVEARTLQAYKRKTELAPRPRLGRWVMGIGRKKS